MNQAVDAAIQTDENTEVRDRLDRAGHLVTLVMGGREGLPGVRHALLDAQRNTAALFVDIQHHHFDFLTGVHCFRGIDVLVGPVHFRNVNKAFHAILDFDKATIVSNI